MWLQVASKNERRGTATPLIRIICFATADVAESGARIELACRKVAFVNFEKHPVHTDTCKTAQMQVDARQAREFLSKVNSG
jgi:hypothetical protein